MCACLSKALRASVSFGDACLTCVRKCVLVCVEYRRGVSPAKHTTNPFGFCDVYTLDYGSHPAPGSAVRVSVGNEGFFPPLRRCLIL